MSERLTPEDVAELHRRRQEDALRKMVAERVEQAMCEALGVRWRDDGEHEDELNARKDLLHRLLDRAKTRSGLISAAGASFREKLMAWIWGGMLALGGAYLAKRFGWPIPGGGS